MNVQSGLKIDESFGVCVNTRTRAGEPSLSIQKNGSAIFNRTLCDAYEIEKYKYVSVFFNNRSGILAFSFSDKEIKNQSIALKTFKGRIHIHISSILRRHNIDCSCTKKFTPLKSEEKNVIFIDTNLGKQVLINRKKKAAVAPEKNGFKN